MAGCHLMGIGCCSPVNQSDSVEVCVILSEKTPFEVNLQFKKKLIKKKVVKYLLTNQAVSKKGNHENYLILKCFYIVHVR